MDNNQDKINYESELILCDGPNCTCQMKIIPIITFDNIHKKNRNFHSIHCYKKYIDNKKSKKKSK